MNQASLNERIELALAEIRPFLQNDGGGHILSFGRAR